MTPNFETVDPHVVVVLALHGHHPTSVTKPLSDTARPVFTFENTIPLTEVLASYEQGTVAGNLKLYRLVYNDTVATIRRVAGAFKKQEAHADITQAGAR